MGEKTKQLEPTWHFTKKTNPRVSLPIVFHIIQTTPKQGISRIKEKFMNRPGSISSLTRRITIPCPIPLMKDSHWSSIFSVNLSFIFFLTMITAFASMTDDAGGGFSSPSEMVDGSVVPMLLSSPLITARMAGALPVFDRNSGNWVIFIFPFPWRPVKAPSGRGDGEAVTVDFSSAGWAANMLATQREVKQRGKRSKDEGGKAENTGNEIKSEVSEEEKVEAFYCIEQRERETLLQADRGHQYRKVKREREREALPFHRRENRERETKKKICPLFRDSERGNDRQCASFFTFYFFFQ